MLAMLGISWSNDAISDLPDDLDLLRTLDVLLAERNVTRAAARLGVSQSAASQRLARLRDFFADELLVSGRGGLVLTPRAAAVKEPLAAALSELRAAVRAGAPFEPGSSERRFTILGNDLVEALAIPRALATITVEAPGVTLSVERTGPDFAERLETGTADLAFVPNFLVHESLRRLPLPRERFVVLLRTGHPASERRLTLPRYLKLDHLLIAPRAQPGSLVDTALAKLGKQRRVVARIQHFVSAPHIVAQSDVALTCPEIVARVARDWFPVVERPLPLSLPLDEASMVWHDRSQDDAGHQWLRRRIAEEAKAQFAETAAAPG